MNANTFIYILMLKHLSTRKVKREIVQTLLAPSQTDSSKVVLLTVE